MYINKVISYGDAWNQLIARSVVYESLVSAIETLTIEKIRQTEIQGFLKNNGKLELQQKMQLCFTKALEVSEWEDCSNLNLSKNSHWSYRHKLGYILNRISASLYFRRESLNRWLFTATPLAYREGVIDIPIALMPLKECSDALFGQSNGFPSEFERNAKDLKAIAPLSHGAPFLILGVSLEASNIELCELPSEKSRADQRIVINRAIEFPPEYHQAGLGILSYFGTILREKYPNENAKVRIEQDGDTVRMIVESETGNRDIIERALYDYELIVRGEASPEILLDTKLQILELKAELRIAQARIENKNEILQHKNQEIETLKQLIGHAFTQKSAPIIHVTASPVITLSNHSEQSNQTAVITRELEDISESIQYLASLTQTEPELELRLRDLEDATQELLSRSDDKNEIKNSSGLRKIRDVITEANETGSALANLFEKASDGLVCLQGIARKYNSIASWCGAPTVPEVFLGKSN
ncbi:hypothetical protein HZU75_08115 [Chitinibacter fontanus]|uniref:Uncharacterized protein n=1 Tax=Chitinibacter fontanus TaxID=1737446 RepID=A0A7D5V9I9_9NEIS|nr:hypothetical protein [Chitinibacter fontanus]QLI81495.1 hypothetical protein HZU75_08115 [Chitinibacter fontanus]